MVTNRKRTGRPRAFDEDEVLGHIMDLFWTNGYFGTSLSMIEQATGLKKQSLYAAFGDKHAMYLAALANYERIVIDGASDALQGSGAPLERITDFLSAPIKAAFDQGDTRGCFLCNASADRAALDPDTERLVERGFRKLETALSKAMAETEKIPDPSNHRQQARLFLAVYAGLRVMARSGLNRAHLESARDLALSLSQISLSPDTSDALPPEES